MAIVQKRDLFSGVMDSFRLIDFDHEDALFIISIQDHVALLDDYVMVLSDEERGRADTFRVQDARVRFVITRALLRYVLSYYLSISPESLIFSIDPLGKPVLIQTNSSFRFSLSHSQNYSLLLLSHCAYPGVDIEYMRSRKRFDGIAARFFSKDEQRWFEEGGKRKHDFYKIWTVKEAILKGLGVGIRFPLSSFSVVDGFSSGFIRLPGSQWVQHETAWAVSSCELCPSYMFAYTVGEKQRLLNRFSI